MRQRQLTPVSTRFFKRNPQQVAVSLLGRYLVRGEVVLRITETEAYDWPDDSANHARAGVTDRNRSMWGQAGRAYVYLCYGVHRLLNLVCGDVGEPVVVLIRAAEPVAGIDIIADRRGHKKGPVLLTGPGKVTQALGIDLRWDGATLDGHGDFDLLVAHGQPHRGTILQGPRVGIDGADRRHVDAPWRYAIPETPWVSVRRTLSHHPAG